MKRVIILADGEFPVHPLPSSLLWEGETIICCDGAAEKLLSTGVVPYAIAGDMDSLSKELQFKYKTIIHKSVCQDTNDLTKAYNLALTLNPTEIIIVGATGLREDHSLGNISLLSDYGANLQATVEMWTNYGKFIPIYRGGTFRVKPGTPISFFALENGLRIRSRGLKFPLDDVIFDSWWKATLNESLGDSFELIYEKGRLLIYVSFSNTIE